MAKEEDLKRVDLKVSVNCCEGCRRKVLKAVSIKGVLNTEIHPSLPKITVTGNVEVRTLIKKLTKSGKSADLWPSEPSNQKEKQKSNNIISDAENNNDKDRIKDISDKHEKSNSSTSKVLTNEHDEIGIHENKNMHGAPKIIQEVEKESYQTVIANIPQVNCLVNPTKIPPYGQVYYPVHPVNPVPAPYYNMNVPCCIHNNCHCQYPANLPPFVQSQQTMGFAEYFNDDNTVGCNVM